MKQIYYEVLTKNQKKINGYYKGSVRDFQNYIKNNDYFLLSFKEKTFKYKNKKFKKKDFLLFIEELLYLLNSGIKIDNALKIILEHIDSKQAKIFIKEIDSLIKEGHSFAESIKLASIRNNIKIDDMSVLLIEANEKVGSIELGLEKSLEHMIFKEDIFKKIINSITYPLFLIILSFFMVFFVFIGIVPKFASIFTPQEFQKLPLFTKYLLNAGLYMQNNYLLIIAGIILIMIFIYLNKQYFFKFWNIINTKIGFIKDLLMTLELSYFFGALGLMLEGGIDLKKALKESSQVITMRNLKSLIDLVYIEVQEGKKISETFSKTNLINEETIALISAGEHSSNLDQILIKLSKKYLEDFESKVKKIVLLLEPTVIILVGIIIGIIVITIMTAILSVNDVIG